jgi:hypothetical protein
LQALVVLGAIEVRVAEVTVAVVEQVAFCTLLLNHLLLVVLQLLLVVVEQALVEATVTELKEAVRLLLD